MKRFSWLYFVVALLVAGVAQAQAQNQSPGSPCTCCNGTACSLGGMNLDSAKGLPYSQQNVPQSPIAFPLNLPIQALPQWSYASILADGIVVKNNTGTNTAPPGEPPVPRPIHESTIKAEFFNGVASLTLENVAYHLKDIHFHRVSEHALNSGHFPMEMHMVHESDNGVNLALGRWITPAPFAGPGSNALSEMFANLPAAGATYTLTQPFNAGALLPTDPRSFRYDGSLTTPQDNGFKTNVKWIMFWEPMELTHEQINAFQALFPNPLGNRRPVQAGPGGIPAAYNLKTDIPEPSTVALLLVAGLLTRWRRGRALRGT